MKEHEAYEAALDTHKRFNPLEISESDFQIGWEAAIDYMMDRVKELEEVLGEGIHLARIYGDMGMMDNWCRDAGNILPKEKQE